MEPEPHAARKLLRSWAIQGIGWYARDELLARTALEMGFVVSLLFLGWPLGIVVVAWLAFHTAAWILLYGGFLRIWVVLGMTTDVERLRNYLHRLSVILSRRDFVRVAFLRGSGARDELGPRSDLDVCLVPFDEAIARVRGILFLWSLRLASVIHGKPVEARWIDYEKYIPYHIIDETPRFLKEPPPDPPEKRLATRGILIAFSGIDGAGKTTASRALLTRLEANGLDASYFYGHRQAWYHRKTGYQLSFAIVFESLWKGIGRSFTDLRRHGFPRAVYAFAMIVDYLYVRRRLSRAMAPSRVVVADRYVADVLAYLRSWGTLRSTLEGLLVGLSPRADLAFVFNIRAEEALKRKREWDLDELRVLLREYANLSSLLSLRAVDAGESSENVLHQLLQVVREELHLAL